MMKFIRKHMKFLVITLAGLWALSTPFMPASEALINSMTRSINGPFETTVVSDAATGIAPSVVSGFGTGNILYGFKVFATGSNGVASLYDTATFYNTSNTQGIFIDEGGTATQSNVYQSDWTQPYLLVTGLTVISDNSVVTIYHDEKQ